MNKSDIQSRGDVEKLIDAFYAQVNQDPLLSPVFAHVDWPSHMPTMYDFWSSILFGDQSYRGNPFVRHQHLPIGAEHFTRWLELFQATVDRSFEGSNAEEIKSRARSIGEIFQHRLGLRPVDIG